MSVTFRQILRALGPHEEAKAHFMNAYKSRGATLDSFVRTRPQAVEALISTEDWLELQRGPKAIELRLALRLLRRDLETQVHP